MTQDVRKRTLFILGLIALIAAAPPPAIAWGGLGHRLVCAIAWIQLDEDERTEVDRLASKFRGPRGLTYRYFTSGCTFADKARILARDGALDWRGYATFERWHFLNVPREASSVLKGHCQGDCVLTGIEHHYRVFANHDRPDAERAEAMLLLAHWIADAHQPMHVAFADDFGGNAVDVEGGYYDENNLHAVWDRGVVKKLVDDRNWWKFAEALSGSVTVRERRRWSRDTPLEWVRESLRVTIDPRTRYCRASGKRCAPLSGARRLNGSYQQYASNIVRERIRRAGVRLAAYLADGLRR